MARECGRWRCCVVIPAGVSFGVGCSGEASAGEFVGRVTRGGKMTRVFWHRRPNCRHVMHKFRRGWSVHLLAARYKCSHLEIEEAIRRAMSKRG